jgi:exodeoxyribonuclease VII large subunit
VLCRGGGSVEDLWAFNELVVAEAIWGASVPVVSGVGHESDTTLADLVADRRAHTPTDAAQCTIPDQAQLLGRMTRALGYLGAAMDRQLTRREERLARCLGARVVRDPRQVFERRAERLRAAGERLRLAGRAALERRERRLDGQAARLSGHSPGVRLERLAERLSSLSMRLERPVAQALSERSSRTDLCARSLEATSPFRVLERGYSITLRESTGEAILDASAVAPGERTLTLLHRGALESRVEALRARRAGQGPGDAAGARREPGDGA